MSNIGLILFIDFFIGCVASTVIFSTQGMTIKRRFEEMPIAVLEPSIRYLDNEAKYNPYYDKTVLESSVKEYLSNSLRGIIGSYQISFNYYYIFNDKPYIFTGDYPSNVDIHLKVNYLDTLNINLYRSYEIENLWVKN